MSSGIDSVTNKVTDSATGTNTQFVDTLGDKLNAAQSSVDKAIQGLKNADDDPAAMIKLQMAVGKYNAAVELQSQMVKNICESLKSIASKI